MAIRWGIFSTKSRQALKIGSLITGGLIAFYMGFARPQELQRSIAAQRITGLGSTSGGWTPSSLWRQSRILPRMSQGESVDHGVVGGVAGGVPGAVRVNAALMTYIDADKSPQAQGEDGSSDRKLLRTATLGLVVEAPALCSEKIIQVATSAGGFLVDSQVSGNAGFPSASLTIRVPAARFDEVRSQIRKLASRVESENVGAQDVTKQYVDETARLRNLRAEEQQYLSILHRATTVKDTLEVSEKLNETRGAIEERQAEFEVLSKQIETVSINVTLRAEADAQVFGLHWRPLYQLKIAARAGLDGIGDYISSMTAFVFYLPTILLWMFTILGGAAIGWRILRWTVRVLFRSTKGAVLESASAR
jgi:Domain of unknown function (DUF4349)